MSFVSFATASTDVPVEGLGIYNGYKLNAILHGGRKINLAKNAYYYIPYKNLIVSYRGSKAKPMVSTDGKYNFIEKFSDRKGHWAFKVDSHMLHMDCLSRFG